jgi:alpha-glucosidase
MQQYSALGYHQARWGYANWSVMADVVATFEKFEIPLEYMWYVLLLDARFLVTYHIPV